MPQRLRNDFLKTLQINVANYSVNISVLRNQGPSGQVKTASTFCKSIDLGEFANALISNSYEPYLSTQTKKIIVFSDESACKLAFGSARKVLNIFFRNICYNTFFKEALFENIDLRDSNSIFNQLELPIDKDVAINLLERQGKSKREWKGVKHLEADGNASYQEWATAYAKEINMPRIHLDLIFWKPTSEAQ